MSFDISKLIKLADKLDANGKFKEANKIDDMIEKLSESPVLVEDTDEEFKKKLQEEGWQDPKVYVGKTPEEIIPPASSILGKQPIEESEIKSEKMSVEKATEEFNEFLDELKDLGISPSHFFDFVKMMPGTILDKTPEGKWETKKSSTIFDKLAVMADKLDTAGAMKEADMIDDFLKKYAKKDDEKKKDEKVEHHIEEYRPGNETMSCRYCPDHIGVMLGRVGEGTYQCPIDGTIYNWRTGWTDMEGKDHPGGSVAGQTPESTGYFTTPIRIFDSREKVLNIIH